MPSPFSSARLFVKGIVAKRKNPGSVLQGSVRTHVRESVAGAGEGGE
jgi:hypothetical protein